MAYIRVKTDYVVDHAKEMILQLDHIEAIKADIVIDELMKFRTFITKVPIYTSRTECIEKEQRIALSNLRVIFSKPSDQKRTCEILLIAARVCTEDTMLIDSDELSALGMNNNDTYTRMPHYWDC